MGLRMLRQFRMMAGFTLVAAGLAGLLLPILPVRKRLKVKRNEQLKKELLGEYGKKKPIKLSDKEVQDITAFVRSLPEKPLPTERACSHLVSRCLRSSFRAAGA